MRASSRDTLDRGELCSPLPGDQMRKRLIRALPKGTQRPVRGWNEYTFFWPWVFCAGSSQIKRPKNHRAPLLLVPVHAASGFGVVAFHADPPR